MSSWTRFLVMLCIAGLSVAGCGQNTKPKDETEETPQLPSAPTVTPAANAAPTATASSVPAETPFAAVWVASNALRAISGYDANGQWLSYIDLSSYIAAGSITAITFINKNTLLVLADPGAAGEKIIRIDLNGNNAAAINANWYQDGTSLNNVSAYKIVKWSNSKLIASKNSTMFEGMTYSISNNAVSRIGAPYINTGLTGTATCNLTVGQYLTTLTLNGVNKLLGVSSGVNARLNLYGNIDGSPTCDASVNFVAGTITAGHIPTGVAQLADGKVYVRYQFTANPAIVRYDYDGTILNNPVVVLNDTGFLNNTVTDRDLVALDGTNLLFANWGTDSIIKFNTATATAEIMIRDLFTTDVNAIGIRPSN